MKLKLLESNGSEGAGFALCQVEIHPNKQVTPQGSCACCTCQCGGACT